MNQPRINHIRAFVPNNQSPGILKPRVCPLYNPSPAVSSQTAAILMRRPFVVTAGGNNRLNTCGNQIFPDPIRIVPSVPNKPFRLSSEPTDLNAVQCKRKKLYFRRGRRVHVKSERSTLAINQYHKLRSLPALGLSDFGAPFFADANVPSTKHSSHRICSRSSSWAKNACHAFSSTPSDAHFWRRRWTVLDFPYFSGRALQGAPLQRIHKMPLKQMRLSTCFRPARSFFLHGLLRTGRCALILSHCSSDNSLNAMIPFPSRSFGIHDTKYFKSQGAISG